MEVILKVSITEKAVKKIREVMSTSEIQSPVLRIHFNGFG
jgi:hypothetical protein